MEGFEKQRNGQLESFIGKRSAMEQVLTQIVSPNDSPEIKLRKIYDRVQQIRNTSNEFEKTEQEVKREKTTRECGGSLEARLWQCRPPELAISRAGQSCRI